MKTEVLSTTLIKMVNHKRLRKILAKKIDDYIYKGIVSDQSEDLREVQIRRYQYLSAMLACINKNVDKGIVSAEILKKIVKVFVQNNLTREDDTYTQAVRRYEQKYGELPPTFIVVSPTQRCNLSCTGCYADSTARAAATIPHFYFDRVVSEAHNLFGCRFVTIIGGYFYVDWHGNVTPCVFIPYYVDNIYNLYENGKTLAGALFSDFMKNGRKWQKEYGLDDSKKPKNWLMLCSIRDHYEVFRNSIMAGDIKPEDDKAKESLESGEYFQTLKRYDEELHKLTEKIWENEYLSI